MFEIDITKDMDLLFCPRTHITKALLLSSTSTPVVFSCLWTFCCISFVELGKKEKCLFLQLVFFFSFNFSDDQRTRRLLKREQFWTKQNVPALLKWCGSDITETTRSARFFNRHENIACIPKGRLASPSEFWQERFLLGNMWETFPGASACHPVGARNGVKNERPLLSCLFPSPPKKMMYGFISGNQR